MSDTTTTANSVIDPAIVAIIARELIEAALFCVDYFGVVLKSETLTRSEKIRYVKYLSVAVFLGLLFGVCISLAIGYGVALAVEDSESVELGVEIGEAISRMIAAWFVIRLALKIPTWFGISKYHDPDTVGKSRVISAPMSFAVSLWWNIWREATEGGSLTALVVIFDHSEDALAASVGVGVAVGVGLGGGLALGGKFVSATVFGIAGAVIAQFLAVGLVTGAVRAWEEVYQGSTGEEGTPIVYETEGDTAAILQSFEFVGISDSFTALTLTVWIFTIIAMTFAQIWHHYYGRALMPRPVRLFFRRAKAFVSRPCKRCCKEPQDLENKDEPSELATTSSENVHDKPEDPDVFWPEEPSPSPAVGAPSSEHVDDQSEVPAYPTYRSYPMYPVY